MRHIKEFAISFLFLFAGLPLVGLIIEDILPRSGMKELFFFFPQMLWMLFKQFFFEDTINTFGLYTMIAIALNGLGIYISKKTENIIYEIITLILSFAGLVKGSIL